MIVIILSSYTVAGEVKKRAVALSLASLKAISICIMNSTSTCGLNELTNPWYCVLGDSSLATVSKLTGIGC